MKAICILAAALAVAPAPLAAQHRHPVRDRAEDRRDTRRFGGIRDLREDRRDRREDVRDRREDVRDRREDVRDRREDRRDRRRGV